MPTHVLDQKRAKDAQKKYATLVDRESKNKMDINSNAIARKSVVNSCIDQNIRKGYAKHYLEPLGGNPKKIDNISDTLVHVSVVSNPLNKGENANNIYTVEKGEKVKYNSLIHSRNYTSPFHPFPQYRYCGKG